MDFQDDIQLLQDSIGGQRSKLDVIASILHICRDGSLKNHIVGRGNFSDAMANHYISILLYRGFLQTGKDKNGRSVYTTTDKGRILLQHYGEIQKLFTGEPAAAAEVESRTPQPRKSIKVLVVDDEPDIASAMKIGLQDYEFYVDVSNDPIQVLKSYIPGSYDLLILDIKMPKMNGFELFKEIKKKDENVKVCYLTAFEVYYEEFKKAFPDIDVTHFIRKPISMSDLVLQIRRLAGS
ncbi:response regulator [Candidatus Nitrososphaera sp. FF02]|uniref:response regulator n=1 Tax=Candidatus Nitrososphaera sp. FF02 TaxID=3398226 RepID=UPI0039EC6858